MLTIVQQSYISVVHTLSLTFRDHNFITSTLFWNLQYLLPQTLSSWGGKQNFHMLTAISTHLSTSVSTHSTFSSVTQRSPMHCALDLVILLSPDYQYFLCGSLSLAYKYIHSILKKSLLTSKPHLAIPLLFNAVAPPPKKNPYLPTM